MVLELGSKAHNKGAYFLMYVERFKPAFRTHDFLIKTQYPPRSKGTNWEGWCSLNVDKLIAIIAAVITIAVALVTMIDALIVQ